LRPENFYNLDGGVFSYREVCSYFAASLCALPALSMLALLSVSVSVRLSLYSKGDWLYVGCQT